MFELNFGIILVFLTGITLVSLPFVNYFYRKKSDRFVENLLADNPVEYNKQIKGNAFGYLISRSILGLFIVSSLIWNFPKVIAAGFRWDTLIFIISGILSILWGIRSYKTELKKLKTLE